MTEGQDTEITLGTGRLLGLFFGLVIVCAIFFGLGFSLGRNSVKNGPLTMEETPSATTVAANGAQKIAAGTPERPAPPPETAEAQPVSDSSVQQAAAAPVVQSPGQATSTPSSGTPSPEMNKGLPLTVAGGAYTVQVAAVSKQEDADALVSALKKKSYPVFIASNGSDKLLHVQIGPFTDIKDAEAMKTKLTGDGYNPIVKR
jgi:DedD protein